MRRAYYIISIFIVVIVTAIIISCRNTEHDKLYVADKMFDQHTDSAAILLKEIDTTRLSAGDKAYWHLLNVRYHHYTHNDDYPDMLAQNEEKQILKRNNPAELQEMYFWKGNAFHNRGDQINGLINTEKSLHYLKIAERAITDRDRTALTAHSYHALSNMWGKLGDLNTSQAYIDSAIYFFSHTVLDMVAYKFSLLSRAELFEAFDHYDEALDVLDTISSRYSKDKKFFRQCKLTSLNTLIGKGDVDAVEAVINELKDDGCDGYVRVLFAEAWVAQQRGDYPTALQKIEAVRFRNHSNASDSYGDEYKPTRYIELHKLIEEKSGNSRQALLKADTILHYYRNVKSGDSQLMARNAIDLFHFQQSDMYMRDARSARIILILIIILSVIVFGGLCMTGVILIKRHRRKTDELLDQLNNLRLSDESHRKSIHALVQARFDTLNRLCDDYLELSELKDKTAVKNEIYKNVTTQLLEMRSPKFKAKLAESVNTDLEGIVDRFRSIEGMTKEEEDLFLYLSAGFSVKAVGVFLDLKKSSIYTRRRRLREKIEQSDSPYKEELLKYI